MPWSASDVVSAWETAEGLIPAERTAALLVALGLAPDHRTALEYDVGRAAALLGTGLAETFGETVEVVVGCPQCGGLLQAQATVPRSPQPGPTAAPTDPETARLPTLGELSRVHGRPDAAATLRHWCAGHTEPGTVLAHLAERTMVQGPVVCPDCEAVFDATLDVAALSWERISTEAPRLLADVAVLASAFGWSEAEILGLSAHRRTAYLQLAGAGP
ncbi:hypothetical protein [Microbacterium sp. A93]|uniref:hypothetical protein n=1 Tax=Microbacterium sp. A93 TaxID=3450716 RepID=UPI003F4378A7